MEIRRAKKEDMEAIMRIVGQAQDYFRQAGIPQWMGDYPNEEVFLNDMKNDSFYLLVEDNIRAFMAAIIGEEVTYDKIYQGDWLLDSSNYLTIHRLAVDQAYKGQALASKLFAWAEELARKNKLDSIRIDTHRDNKSMLSLIEKNGFSYCGIVYMTDGGERVAYEKVLED